MAYTEKMLEELKKIQIHNDGRASLYDLYRRFLELETNYGWKKEEVYRIGVEDGEGTVEVPVFCFLSPKTGDALWLITGIHGEEPAGPNAVMKQVDYIGNLGLKIPMVVMPLLNPAGYYRNFRFHNVERSIERLNVTDSRHLIARTDDPSKPILEKPIHDVADITTKYILKTMEEYPPKMFFDLHEDEQLEEGYVYSQGMMDKNDPVAAKTVELFLKSGVKLKMSGTTRFAGEFIENGLVVDAKGGRIKDGSVDEFMANETYINNNGEVVPKIFAKTSIVTETPGKGKLVDRIHTQESVVAHLEELWKMAQ